MNRRNIQITSAGKACFQREKNKISNNTNDTFADKANA